MFSAFAVGELSFEVLSECYMFQFLQVDSSKLKHIFRGTFKSLADGSRKNIFPRNLIICNYET